MTFIDAMEIVITLAEDNALDENAPEVSSNPTLVEAAQGQKEALQRIRRFHEDAKVAAAKFACVSSRN